MTKIPGFAALCHGRSGEETLKIARAQRAHPSLDKAARFW